MADPVEPVRNGMLQEASDEFIGRQRHDLSLAVMAVVLPAETDLAIDELDQTAVGDGDPVRIPAQVAEHLFGAGERPLGIDHPFQLAYPAEIVGECIWRRERRGRAADAQRTSVESLLKPLQE